jgi:hypothetical protein
MGKPWVTRPQRLRRTGVHRPADGCMRSFDIAPKWKCNSFSSCPARLSALQSFSTGWGVWVFCCPFLHLQPFRRIPTGRAEQRFSGALAWWHYGQCLSPGPGIAGPLKGTAANQRRARQFRSSTLDSNLSAGGLWPIRRTFFPRSTSRGRSTGPFQHRGPGGSPHRRSRTEQPSPFNPKRT